MSKVVSGIIAAVAAIVVIIVLSSCLLASEPTRPVIVAFTATWCGPCKVAQATLDTARASGELDGIDLRYVDIDQHRALAERYGVSSVPTIFVGTDAVKLRTHNAGEAIQKAKELRDDR